MQNSISCPHGCLLGQLQIYYNTLNVYFSNKFVMHKLNKYIEFSQVFSSIQSIYTNLLFTEVFIIQSMN